MRNETGNEEDRNYNVGSEEKSKEAARESSPRFFIAKYAGRFHTSATNYRGNMIIRWMPNCHEERYAFGLWGALLSLMLNCYARAVYSRALISVFLCVFSADSASLR